MRKTLSLILALTLALGVCAWPAAASEDEDYFASESARGLINQAEEALSEGKDPAWILRELDRAADEYELTEELQYLRENIAAADNADYRKIVRVIGDPKDSDRHLAIYSPLSGENDYYSSWSAYDLPDVSAELKALFRDDDAEFCFEPAWWSEDEFQSVFGTSYQKFTPKRPRPGYVCVVLAKGSQNAPETAWNKGEDTWKTDSIIYNTVSSLVWSLGDDAPVLTGNPHLASAFWVVDHTYSFHAYYGEDREVKGYNCSISLVAETAAKKQNIAKISAKETLGNTIYSWSNGVSAADTPDLSLQDKYASFVNTVRSSLIKERAAADANRPITEGNAQKKLAGTLAELADGTDDPWEKAIYQSSVQGAEWNDGTLTFRLHVYDPDLENMVPFRESENPENWLFGALDNAAYAEAEFSLRVYKGVFTHTALSNLKKTAKAAAQKARQAFEGEDMTAAFREWLFPAPVDGKVSRAAQLLEPSDTFRNRVYDISSDTGVPAEALAPLFYTRQDLTVNAAKGPFEIRLESSGPDAAQLVSDAAKSTLDELAFTAAADRADPETLFPETLAKLALREKGSGGGSAFTISVVNGLKYPDEYLSWVSACVYNDKLSQIRDTAERLPDEAAQEMPKTGRMSGGRSGTRVNLVLSESADPTYVQLRNERNGKVAATAFIHPGQEATVYVASGTYTLLFASGPYWYGEYLMFDSLGSYDKLESIKIRGSEYVHTYTLESVPDGNITVHDADPSEFRQ